MPGINGPKGTFISKYTDEERVLANRAKWTKWAAKPESKAIIDRIKKKSVVKCRDSRNARQRARYATDPEYREKIIRETTEAARKNPQVNQRAHRKMSYGITDEVLSKMLEEQLYKCAICFSPISLATTTTKSTVCIDHNRKCCPGNKSCGKCVRGLLCRTCNLGIGHFLDSVPSIEKGIEYLVTFDSNLISSQLTYHPIYKRWNVSKGAYKYIGESQNNLCFTCGVSLDIGRWNTDHDKVSGRVRGILCTSCNFGLGFLKDSTELLKSAIVYIEKGEGNG